MVGQGYDDNRARITAQFVLVITYRTIRANRVLACFRPQKRVVRLTALIVWTQFPSLAAGKCPERGLLREFTYPL